MPGKIFLNYRRSDTSAAAQLVARELTSQLGEDAVFLDVHGIPLGVNFHDYLQQQIALSSMMLVLIGPNWLTLPDERGRRRLDNPNDFVRLEIEAAFRYEKPVVPLLIDDTPFPKENELPDSLKPLIRSNGAVVRLGAYFQEDVSRLATQLQRFIHVPRGYLPPEFVSPSPQPEEEVSGEIHPDIFISYASLDRRLAEAQAADLEARGYTVWWDTRLIGGQKYRKVILKYLRASKAVIVIWTKTSVESDWVYDEATRAWRATKLIPTRVEDLDIDEIDPPFGALETLLFGDQPRLHLALANLGVKPKL
ncbi:MAG: toll/interleukin-1 receptor domain-containing protein [Rhodomicrobium sp.]